MSYIVQFVYSMRLTALVATYLNLKFFSWNNVNINLLFLVVILHIRFLSKKCFFYEVLVLFLILNEPKKSFYGCSCLTIDQFSY